MHRVAVAAAALPLGLCAGPAMADSTAQEIKAAIIEKYEAIDARTPDRSEGTSLGDAIQGGFFGNAANPTPSGHGTLPSQSPGPWKNNPTDPENPTWALTWGEVKREANPSNF